MLEGWKVEAGWRRRRKHGFPAGLCGVGQVILSLSRRRSVKKVFLNMDHLSSSFIMLHNCFSVCFSVACLLVYIYILNRSRLCFRFLRRVRNNGVAETDFGP